MRGHHEAELALLPLLVQPRDHVLDVGANRGLYAYALHRLMVTLHLFEPNPDCSKLLTAWAKVSQRVCVHPVALGASEGVLPLYVPRDREGVLHDASGSLTQPDLDSEKEAISVDVQVKTLDHYAFPRVDLIKIDVEGHEVDVINGGRATIARFNPALLVEIEQRHHQQTIESIFAFITSLGYRGFFLQHNYLCSIDCFEKDRDQALAHFGCPGSPYVNNFLFLHEALIAKGRYRKFLGQWVR